MQDNCFIKSITLQAGEPFTLPPGATIISTDDPGSIEGDCVDLTNLETLECYCFQVLATEEAGGTDPVFKWNNVAVYGLFLSDSNTLYSFVPSYLTGIGPIQINIANYMYNTPSIGALITDVCVTYDNDGAVDRGQVLTICFKTLPSIGSKLFLQASTHAQLSPDFTSYYYLPAIPHVDVTSNKCACDIGLGV